MKTSIKALTEQIQSGKLISDTHTILYHIMDKGSLTIVDLMNITKKPIQTVSARLSDLQDMGVIEILPYVNSNHNYYKYQSDPYKQAKNAYKRKYKKFLDWQKRGQRDFKDFMDGNQLKIPV